jgi:hypothetical protein
MKRRNPKEAKRYRKPEPPTPQFVTPSGPRLLPSADDVDWAAWVDREKFRYDKRFGPGASDDVDWEAEVYRERAKVEHELRRQYGTSAGYRLEARRGRSQPLIDDKLYTVTWNGGRQGNLTGLEAVELVRQLREDWAAAGRQGILNIQVFYRDGSPVPFADLERQFFHGPPRPMRSRETSHVADFNSLDDLIAHAARDLGATYVVVAGAHTKLYFPRGGQYPFEEARVWRKGGYWHAEGPGARRGVQNLPANARPIGVTPSRRAAEAPRRSGPKPYRPARGRVGFTIHKVLSGPGGGKDVYFSDGFMINVHRGEGTGWWYAMRPFDKTYENRVLSLPEIQAHQYAALGAALEDRASSVRYLIASDGMLYAEMREGTRVEDYEAVDNRGRTIAGPFKHYGDAKDATGPAGHVKFVPSRGASRTAETRNPRRSAHTKRRRKSR